MRNLILTQSFMLLVILSLLSCSGNKSTDQKNVKTADSTDHRSQDAALPDKQVNVPALAFPLDSLLAFDSETDLINSFGEKTTRIKGFYPEGMGEYTITLLFPGTTNEVGFVWKDDSVTYSGLLYVTVFAKKSNWKTKEGITIGTKLTELEKLNKKPFKFYGFGWDYSGLTSWNEGELSTHHVSVTLERPENTIQQPDGDELNSDREFDSNSKIAQTVNPIVCEINVHRSDREYD